VTDDLQMWTIYFHPRDYPDGFVARMWVISSKGAAATDMVLTASTLEEIRNKLPLGLTRLERDPADEPQIVETWL